jgi:hypothetical protein
MTEKTNDRGTLVILYLSGGLKLVGSIEDRELVKAGEALELRNVWQINQMMAPLPTGEGITQMTVLMPPPGARTCMARMNIVPETWIFPDEAGCLEHIEELLTQVEGAADVARAKDAGIQLVKPGQIPPVAPPNLR